ncbi:MAG: 50S ribosomal protein L17 [Ardenticatenaceae bacterium]
MRHRVRKRHLGRDVAHRKALYRNLITDLLDHERIITTEAKAKAVKPLAEKLITTACRALNADSAGKVHARRRALRVLTNKEVMFKLFEELANDYADRPGGYTRIVKLGPRRGDGAKMVMLELVD